MEICLLGTAPGLPLADRFAQTTVVTVAGPDGGPRHIVLDTGDGASSHLIRNGFNHRSISVIVISHMHGDHHAGLIQVIKTSMHLSRTDDLIILAPREGIAALQAYLAASYLYPDWLGYTIHWLPLSDALDNDIALPNEMRFRAFANNHLDSARARFAAFGIDDHGRSFESYSMALEHGGARFVYSGNLLGAKGADEMAEFIEPADLLVCELAHVDPTELGRFLAGRRVARTLLAHISPKWQSTPDDDIVRLVHAGSGSTGLVGEVTVARDGDTCTVIAEPNAA